MGDEEFIFILNELVVCCRKSDGLFCLDQLFGFLFDMILEFDNFLFFLIVFLDFFFYGKIGSDILLNIIVYSIDGFIFFVFDILYVVSEVFVFFVMIMGFGDDYILLVVCNSQY